MVQRGFYWRIEFTALFVVEPVVQALMLIDVVVEVAVMALLPALAVEVYERTGQLDSNDLSILQG